jgi:hypothetical protein
MALVRASLRQRWGTSQVIALGLPVCASLALLLWLGTTEFPNYDGVWHVFIARQENWASFWREVNDNAHPPLFYLLLAGSINLFGKSLLAYRAVSIVSTLLATLFVARSVTTLTSSRWSGLMAAAAFGVSFNAVEIGTEVRAYALCTSMLVVAFSFYLEWLAAHPSRFPAWKRLVFAGALTLAILANYSSFFFLAAALGVPVLLFLSHRRWRVRFWLEATRHRGAAALMFLVPTIAAVVAYRLHVRQWGQTGRLGHVQAFMFNGGQESIWSFMARGTRSLVLLALPPLPSSGWVAVAIGAAALVGALLLIARRRCRSRLTVVPLFLLGVMLLLNLLAAVVARYPFGGQMRQEFFLFPFAIISLFTGLDAVRRLLPMPWSSPFAWMGAAAVAVGASSWLWISAFQGDTRPPLQQQVDDFRTAFVRPTTVLVDQYNFIIFYGYHHDWDWHLKWEDTRRGLWQIWEVSRAGQRFEVCRDREWQLDLSKVGAYGDLAECIRRTGPVTVFRPQQPEYEAGWDLAQTPLLARQLGAKAGIVPTDVFIKGTDLYLGFQSIAAASRTTHGISVVEATYGANCGARSGNATELVHRKCAESDRCLYQVWVEELGDPSPACPKNFATSWTCGGDGRLRSTVVAAEAGFGSTAILTCAP